MTGDHPSIMTTARELKASPLATDCPSVEASKPNFIKIASPSSALRRVAWMVLRAAARLCFRVHVRGEQHIPAAGGALLIANSLSQSDVLFLAVGSSRPILFAGRSDLKSKRRGLFGWCIELFCVARSKEEWLAKIRSGNLVCVFGEGELSRIGQMLSFGNETKRIIEDVDAPIIPVALDGAAFGGVWREGPPRPLASAPTRWRKQVSVIIGTPNSSGATPTALFQELQELITAAWNDRRSEMQPLHRVFVTNARKHPFRFAMGDSRTPRLNFISTLARTIYLARRLASQWGGQKYLGILLPPSIAGALVNFAALLAGKIPVNLNYTASIEQSHLAWTNAEFRP